MTSRCEPPPEWRDTERHVLSNQGVESVWVWYSKNPGWLGSQGHTWFSCEKLAQLNYRYIAPVLTPDEIAEQIAAARDNALEEAAKYADVENVSACDELEATADRRRQEDMRRAAEAKLRAAADEIRANALANDREPLDQRGMETYQARLAVVLAWIEGTAAAITALSIKDKPE